MDTYRISKTSLSGTASSVIRNELTCIPLDMNNQDCVKFLHDWRNGAEVKDADGNALPYSAEAARGLGLIEIIA